MEGPKFLGQGVVVVADEGEDSDGCGGQRRPQACEVAGSSQWGWWRGEPSAAEGGDVYPQLGGEVFEWASKDLAWRSSSPLL